MNLKEAVKIIEKNVEERINQNNTGKEVKFYIDTVRLGNRLSSYFDQDLDNLTLNLTAIENVVLEPISLVEYAKTNERSYSSIFQNKERYASLKETKRKNNNTYTVANMELCHSDRVENNFGEKVEYLVRQNRTVSKGLIDLSKEFGTDIGTTIYRILAERVGK